MIALTKPVHPRACGERSIKVMTWVWDGGSSPRLRGTRVGSLLAFAPDRFIPAPAGNAAPREAENKAGAVHPRACGER